MLGMTFTTGVNDMAKKKDFYGLTEDDYRAYEQYLVENTDGEALRQRVEQAATRMNTGVSVMDKRRALHEYEGLVNNLNTLRQLGTKVPNVDDSYMQSLYDQYNQSWNDLQRQIQNNRMSQQMGLGGLGMQTAAGIAPNGAQFDRDPLSQHLKPGRGLMNFDTMTPTEANQQAAQRNWYQQAITDAQNKQVQWGDQALQYGEDAQTAQDWTQIVQNLPTTNDARVNASNQEWMRQAAEANGIDQWADREDLLRQLQAKEDKAQRMGDTPMRLAQQGAAQERGYQEALYQTEHPEVSLDGAYYLSEAEKYEAQKRERYLHGDLWNGTIALLREARARDSYGQIYYDENKREQLSQIMADPELGQAYQSAQQMTWDLRTVEYLDEYIKGALNTNGVLTADDIGQIRLVALQNNIDLPEDDGQIQQEVNRMLRQYSEQLEADMTILEAAGYDRAQLAEYMERSIDSAEMREYNEQNRAAAEENGFGMSVASTGANVVSGMGYISAIPQSIKNIWATLSGNYDAYAPINTDSNWFRAGNFVKEVRDEVSQNLAAQYPNGTIMGENAASFLYGTGMSMLDNIVQMAMGAALFGGAGSLPGAISAGSPVTLGVMGLSAATNDLITLTDEGVPAGQAMLLSTLRGGLEILTEKIGIDALVSGMGRQQMGNLVKQIAASMLRQGAAEGAEEAIAEVGGDLADLLVRADESEMRQAIAEGMASGLTEKEALIQYVMDLGKRTAVAATGGFLSGLGFGGGAVATNLATDTNKARGETVLNNRTLPQLQQQAGFYGVDASGITEQSTARDIGRVHRQVEAAARGAEEELLQFARGKKYTQDGIQALQHAYAEYSNSGAGKMGPQEFAISFDTAYQHGKSDAKFGAGRSYLERAAKDGLTAGLTPGTIAYAYHSGVAAIKRTAKAKSETVKQGVAEKKNAARAAQTAKTANVMQVEQIGEHDAVLVMPDGSKQNITQMDTRGTAAQIVAEAMDDGYGAVVVNQMLRGYDGNMDPADYYEQFRTAMLAGIEGESLSQAKKAATQLPAAVAKEAHDRGRLLGKAYDLADRIGSAGEQALDRYGYAAPAEFEKFYKAGLEGKSFWQAVKGLGEVSEEIKDEMQAAVNAGLRDNKGGFKYGEQSHGNGQERKADVDPGQRSGRVAEGAVDESGRARPAQGRAAGEAAGKNTGTAEKVSARNLGLEDGTDRASARIIQADRMTEEQRAKVQEYANAGAELVLIEGYLEIQAEAGTTIARGAQFGDRIIASVSDPGATWEQIARHEAKHRYFRQHPDALQQEWDLYTSHLSAEEINRWLAAYAEQYAALSDEITVEYLMEEALCDWAADIDYTDASPAGYEALETVRENVQKNTAREGGRYSLSDRIALGSSEDERYQILKNRTLKIALINKQKADQISQEDMRNLATANRTTAFKILRKIGDEFDVFKDYTIKDFDLEFAYSKRNLQESINKQGREYNNYALMLTELENIIENAVGIETHNHRYGEEDQIKQTYVFASAMQTGNRIIPILLEVREFWDGTKSTLRIAIAMSEIERSRIVEHIPPNMMSDQSYSLPASTIKISELFSNVNSKDGRLLKYIPDGFLNETQKKGKATALIEQKEYARKKIEHKMQKLSAAGRNAATANLEALERAEQMEKAGGSVGEIYRETGWFRGADRQWRFEIDDSTMRYYKGGDAKFRKMHPGYVRHQELTTKMIDGTITEEEYQELRNSIWHREYGRLKERVDRGNAHLDDILDHDALFEAYPQLRDVKIEFAPLQPGVMGFFRRRDNKIYLSEALQRAPEDTLVHEIQHAIQALEGFANGSSTAYWERIVENGGKIDSMYLRNATAAVMQFEANPANAAVVEARNRLNEIWDTEGVRAGNAYYAQLETEGMAAKVDAYEDLLWEQSSASVWYAAPSELYENTAGEQEARDTAARRSMTAEQRRKQMPQTGNKDTVFAEGSMVAMSEEKQTPEQQLKEAEKRIKQLEGINQHLREQMKLTPDYTPDARQIRKAAKLLMAEYGGSWSQQEMEAKLASLWKSEQLRGKGEISFEKLMDQTRRVASELVRNYLDRDNQDLETLRDIKQYVRSTRIYLSPDLRADLDHYGGYAAVRKANFGKLRLANSGTGVDQIYMELHEQWPAYFPEEIWNPADQLMQIIDVINDGTQVLQRSPLDGMPDAMDYMTNKILWELGLVNPAPKTKADELMDAAAKVSNRDHLMQAAAAHEQEQMDQLEAFYKQKLQQVKNDREDKIQKIKDGYRQKAQEQRDWKAEQEVKRKLLYHAGKLKRMSRKVGPEQQKQILEIFGDINTMCQRMTGYTIVRDYIQGMSTDEIRPEGYRDLSDPGRIMDTEEGAMLPEYRGDKMVDLDNLKKWYDGQKKNNPDFIPDKRIEEILESWEAKQINTMTVQEAQALLDVALNIENEIRTQKQLIDAQDRREVYQQVQDIVDNVNSTKGKYDNLLSRGLTGWMTENTLSPVRMIQRLTGYHDSDPMYQATIALQQGEMKMLDYQRRAYDLFKPFTEDRKFMDYLAGKGKQAPITIGGMDERGNIIEVKITPDMRVALYLHSQNYQNLRHIQRGGLTVPHYESYVKGKMEEAYDRATRLRLTPSQVRQITSHMTQRELAYAKRLEKYFNVMSKTEINETSVKLKGYEIAKTNHYYPIETNRDFVVKEFDSLKFDGSLENMGFTKERIEGGNPIMLGNASTTLARSVKQHSMYTGLAIPLRNFNKLRGVSIVKSDEAGAVKYQADSLMDTLRRKWGKSGLDYIEKMVTDLSGVKPQQERGMEVLNKLRSNYAGAVLELNPSTAMKQLIAYPSAASVLGWDAMAVGLNKWQRVNIDEINKYTPLLWHRMQGYIDSDLGDYVANKKHKPRALNWNQAVDVAVVKRIWKAAEWKVAHDNRVLVQNRDAWMKATAELFNQVMLQSQANYTAMQRGQILRTDNIFLRSIAMFKTEPFQSFNVLYDAFANEAAKRRQLAAAREEAAADNAEAHEARIQELEQAHKAAKQRIAQAVPAVLTSNLLEALITFAWAFFRGKQDDWEDDETGEITAGSFFKRLGMRTLGNLGGIVPFGAEMAELITAVVMGDQYYGIENMETSMIADAMTNFYTLANTIKGWLEKPEEGEEKQLEAYDIVLEVLDQSLKLGAMFGLPTENVAKTLKGITRWALIAAMGEAEGEYWYRRFTSQTTGSGHSKEDLDALYQVAAEGDMEAYNRLRQSILRYKDEASVQSGLTSRIQAATKAGEIDADTAMDLLGLVTGETDPNELFWKVQGWQYMAQTGEDSFSRYDLIYDAMYDGTGFDEAYQQLLDHGVSEEDARSAIRGQIRDWYQGKSADELTISEQDALQMLQEYGGKSSEDARAQILEWNCLIDTGIAYGDIKQSVLEGVITEAQAADMLQQYGGKTAEEAAETAAAYGFMYDHPELAEEYEPSFVNKVAGKYAVYGSGIDVNVYADFVEFAENTSADQDENGNWISGSRKAKIVAYIAALPGLTPEQRDNLMLTDYSTYNLDDTPW